MGYKTHRENQESLNERKTPAPTNQRETQGRWNETGTKNCELEEVRIFTMGRGTEEHENSKTTLQRGRDGGPHVNRVHVQARTQGILDEL